jgi:hypothetical protein
VSSSQRNSTNTSGERIKFAIDASARKMSKGGLEFGGNLHELARERPTFSNCGARLIWRCLAPAGDKFAKRHTDSVMPQREARYSGMRDPGRPSPVPRSAGGSGALSFADGDSNGVLDKTGPVAIGKLFSARGQAKVLRSTPGLQRAPYSHMRMRRAARSALALVR